MKEILSLLIALLLCLFAFASCDNVPFQNDDSQTTNDTIDTGVDTPVCSRINLCYHGNKDTSITIEDDGICSELMTLITKADGTQGESSKGYYGVPYTLTIYYEGNEAPLVFCLWSDSQYSTSEQRDAEGYHYFFNDDLSDLYQYLEEKYPDEFWYSNNSQSGDNSGNHDASDIRISWANWLDGSTVDEGCLNFDQLAISSVHHIPLHKFSSRSELVVFKARFGEDNSFDYGYNGKSFNENTADYDDAFFEENNLFLVYVDANSGSLQFDVNSIFNDGNSFCIYVNQTNNPEVVTDDMAGWFITVAMPKSATENCTVFDAIMGYGSKHSLTVIDESGHLVDVNSPKEYCAGDVVTLKGQLVYDTYLTFYVDDVRIDVEQENVDNYLYYSFVMPSKDTTVVCKLVSVSPPPAPQ